jgi:hypothetical protein
MKTRNAAIILMLGLLLATGCSDDSVRPPDTERDTLTIAFQDGAEPVTSYFGTRDAVIKDGPAPEFYHGNFGGAFNDTLGIVYLGSDYYERRLLLRMDVSDLTGCSSVLDARLSLRIESDIADSLVLKLYEAVVPPSLPDSWVEGTGGLFEGVSWHEADGATPWKTQGGDFAYPPLDEQTVRTDTTVTFSLPGMLVLSWIRLPYTNNGVIIKARDTGGERYILVHLRESTTTAFRPRLDLVYFKSG